VKHWLDGGSRENVAHVLLISYRHMYVREINLRQRSTRSMVLPLEGRT